MKRFVLVFIFLTVCLFMYGQKSYVSVYVNLNSPDNNWVSARISGNVPSGIKTYYAATYDRLTEGEIINLLANRGYVVEKITGIGETSSLILMSYVSDDSNVITHYYNNDTDVQEIARYNLQGIPVNSNESGVQIVVYSNYTTKTVIVQ